MLVGETLGNAHHGDRSERSGVGQELSGPALLTASEKHASLPVCGECSETTDGVARESKAGKLVGLVDVLYQQHQAGRRLTDTILRLVPTSATPGDDRHKLVQTMQAFIRMYRPHEAREDTVLFPALRSVVSPNEFDAMGEDFEKDERQKFGEDGFEKMVSHVADLERTLGIYDLSKFTPT